MTRRRLMQVGGGAAAASLVAGGTVLGERPGRDERRIMSDRSDLLGSRHVAVGGRPVHTLVSTLPVSGEAPPVVLVHGLALSGQYMVPTAEALAPHYRVLVPDFPGFGDSHKPADVLDVPALADALAVWMDALDLEPAVLLGNSFGCQIIGELAMCHPDRVRCGVLQGPTAPPDERTWFWQFVRWRQNSPHNPPEMETLADIDYGKCGIARALATFDHSLRDGLEDKLGHIDAPMLVVRGSEDPICSQGWAERVAEGLPRGELAVIPDVAHTLVFTSPEELSAVSRPFVEAAMERSTTAPSA